MNTLLTAILVACIGFSASAAFASECEKKMSPLQYGNPFKDLELPSNSPEYLAELNVRLTRTRASINEYIRGYRTVGGIVYWMHQKLKGKYARFVNLEEFRVRSAQLGRMGTDMRFYYSSLKKGILSPEMKASIEDAIADYGRLEIHEPLPEGQIEIPRSAGTR